jgi:hypothetical protein
MLKYHSELSSGPHVNERASRADEHGGAMATAHRLRASGCRQPGRHLQVSCPATGMSVRTECPCLWSCCGHVSKDSILCCRHDRRMSSFYCPAVDMSARMSSFYCPAIDMSARMSSFYCPAVDMSARMSSFYCPAVDISAGCHLSIVLL